MGKFENIERQIKDLSPQEMAELREWFAAFDAEAWDRSLKLMFAPGNSMRWPRRRYRPIRYHYH